MATIDANISSAANRSILDWIATAASTAAEWMVGAGRKSSAARAAENFTRLNGLSDAELAARGLTREALVAHCFGHLMVS